MCPLQALDLFAGHFDVRDSLLQHYYLAAFSHLRGIQLRDQEFQIADKIVQFLPPLLRYDVVLNLLTLGLAHLSCTPRTEPQLTQEFLFSPFSIMSISAVILVGGPRTTTHFRPLSLNVPQPLFPLGGKPMIYHHIKSCSQVSGLEEVFLVGDFEEDVFSTFMQETSSELNIKLRCVIFCLC